MGDSSASVFLLHFSKHTEDGHHPLGSYARRTLCQLLYPLCSNVIPATNV